MEDSLFAEPKSFGQSIPVAMEHLYVQKPRSRREPMSFCDKLFVAAIAMMIIALVGSSVAQLL